MAHRSNYADGGATPVPGNITASDMNGISADLDAAATKTGIETLTNKTLTSPRVDEIRNTGGGMVLAPGTNAVRFYDPTTGCLGLAFFGNASAVNYVSSDNATTGISPTIGGSGSDTDVGLRLGTQGAGVVVARDNGTYREVATISGTQTLTNKTLTNPKINTILDTNGNESLILAAVGSAVNELTIVNNVAGSGPIIRASGDDGTVDLVMQSKGYGNIVCYDGGFRPMFTHAAITSAVNYPLTENSAAGQPVKFGCWGSDTNVDLNIGTKGTGVVKANNVPVATTTDIQTLTNKTVTAPILSGTVTGTYTLGGTPTISSPTVTALATTDGIAAVNLPNGITNGNTSRQSQAVVSGTSYYITGSNLNLPATLKAGMAVGTRFRWRVAMDKTAAGTGAFAIEIRRGTAGTTSDTADVSQSVGTQTAVIDNMVVDVEMVVTTTGATGAYYWTIVPVNTVSSTTTAAGFGVPKHTAAFFAGTVSSVAMNTASLKFGLSFKATTGTPTISIPLVQASAINIC